MSDRNLGLVFTIAATFTIFMCLASAVTSVFTGEWLAFTWQLIAAVGFGTAMVQERRVKHAKEVRDV